MVQFIWFPSWEQELRFRDRPQFFSSADRGKQFFGYSIIYLSSISLVLHPRDQWSWLIWRSFADLAKYAPQNFFSIPSLSLFLLSEFMQRLINSCWLSPSALFKSCRLFNFKCQGSLLIQMEPVSTVQVWFFPKHSSVPNKLESLLATSISHWDISVLPV